MTIERQKIVRTFDVFAEDTVRIRWFLPKEGGYYEQEYEIPPPEVRKVRDDNRRISASGVEDSPKESAT